MGDRAIADNPVTPPITRWGPTALIAVLAYAIPVQLLVWLPHVGLHLPERIAGNISIIVFDYGLLIDLLLLIICIVAVTHDAGHRRLAWTALLVLVASTVLMFLG
jgi:hypothetical protein